MTPKPAKPKDSELTDTEMLDWLTRKGRDHGIRASIDAIFDDEVWRTKRPDDKDTYTRKHENLRAAIAFRMHQERKGKRD